MKNLLRTLGTPLVVGFLLLVSLSPFAASASSATYTSGLATSPLSNGLLMAQAIHSGRIQLHDALSTPDKKHPFLKNVQASEGGQPVNEDPIAVSPANAMNVLTGGNDYNCGSTLRGFFTSSDGGKTFSHHCAGSGSFSGGCGDPGVGYDTNGVAYASGINSNDGCGTSVVGVESSKDNGKTWQAAVTAVTSTLGGLVDKPWLQVDITSTSPHANALYISSTQFGSNNSSEISVSHSYDGNKTWKTVVVDTQQQYPTIDQFSDLAIGTDGTVYVSWMRCVANGPSGDCGGTTASFYISKSTDGGKTWSAPSLMVKAALAPDTCGGFYGCLPHTSERLSNVAATAIDNTSGSNAGHLYSALYNWTGTFAQVEVVSSSNGGTSWSSPVPVTTGTIKWDQFFPWLTVSATGVVGVTWLDRRNDKSDLSYEAFAATSTTGGASFGKNIKIATKPSNPLNDGFGGGFMGDYTGNYWSGKKLYASWMDSRNGSNMQDEVGGLKSKA